MAGQEQEVVSSGQGKLALAQGGSVFPRLEMNDIKGKGNWETIAAWG